MQRSNYQHQYIQNDKIVTEKTEQESLLLFLYASCLGGLLRFFLRRHFFSRVYGWYQSSRLSRRGINKFIARHSLDMSDFIEPQEGYRSFNDFFCRALKPGARVIGAARDGLVSPTDAKCLVISQLSADSYFFVKGAKFSLSSFLQDANFAREFEGGSVLLLRLAPYDYHRFHAPLAGGYTQPYPISGVLESVNPYVFKQGGMPLTTNERHVLIVSPEHTHQKILMVPVGAMCVGKIGYYPSLPAALNKGDELGYFAFGGSSIVLLMPKNFMVLREDLVTNTARGFETAVRVGEVLGTLCHE